MAIDKQELKTRLYNILDDLSVYHDDLTPTRRMSLNSLMDTYFYWGSEYNDGYLGYDWGDCVDDYDRYLLYKFKLSQGELDSETPLTAQQVTDLWEVAPLYIDFGDSDAICQENGYTLDEIIDYVNSGYDVFIDEF